MSKSKVSQRRDATFGSDVLPNTLRIVCALVTGGRLCEVASLEKEERRVRESSENDETEGRAGRNRRGEWREGAVAKGEEGGTESKREIQLQGAEESGEETCVVRTGRRIAPPVGSAERSATE